MTLIGIMIVFWVVVLAVVGFFVIKEVRSKRRGPNEFDRYGHEAVRQAHTDQSMRGPNNTSQIGFGG